MTRKETKTGLEHPGDDAHELVKLIWYAGGPGRAWKWEQWALKIKQNDLLYPLAQNVLDQVQNVLDQVKEIRACYNKGADARANLLVERLERTQFKVPHFQAIEKLSAYSGGRKKGAGRESTKIIRDLRSQFPNEDHKTFFCRLEKDKRFAKLDDDTLQCLSDERTLKRHSFSYLLSKLK